VFPLETPDAPLQSSRDVSVFLAESINAVRKGELDPRVANAVGYLASIQLRALEQGPTEQRIAALEMTLGLVPKAPGSAGKELAAHVDKNHS